VITQIHWTEANGGPRTVALSEVVRCSDAIYEFANPGGLESRTHRGPAQKRQRSSRNKTGLDTHTRSLALAARRRLRNL
jgi:hypothetical protein